MAINKNHEFEELNGIKCAVVEKNVKPPRVAFLKDLLTWNGYTVVVVPSPPPKAAPATKPADGETVAELVPPPPAIETCTVGVTDVMFNAINAVFGRNLHTKDGSIVTLAYWKQEEAKSNDSIPYFSEDEYIQTWK
jgi:hypothetical protein